MMTLKETADAAISHLLQQGEEAKSSDPSSRCVFRNNAGLCCFVGGLIKAENYKPELEDISLRDVARNWNAYGVQEDELSKALLASGVDMSNKSVRDFLVEGQEVHDRTGSNNFLEEVTEKCKSLRAKYGI